MSYSFDIHTWQATLLDHIMKKENIEDDYKIFHKFVLQLQKNGILNEPYSGETENFFSFLSTVTKSILKTRVSSDLISQYNRFLLDILSLFSKLFINSTTPFIESASKIVTDSHSSFYISNSSFFQQKYSSRIYESNCSAFSKSCSLATLINYFKNPPDISLEKYYWLHSLFYTTRNSYDNNQFQTMIESSSKCYSTIITNIDDNMLRSIDEKLAIKTFKDLAFYLKKNSNSFKLLLQSFFNLTIRFVKSSYLGKQFSGLNFITFSLSKYRDSFSDLFSALQESQVVDYLLQKMHHELAYEFSNLLKILSSKNQVSTTQLHQFWNLFISQHSTTIDFFFKAWISLFPSLQPEMQHSLWQLMPQSQEFPEVVLQFFINVANRGTNDERYILFNAIAKQFKNYSGDINLRTTFYNTLDALLPNDLTICLEVQNQCFDLIKQHKDLEMALALFRASCKKVSGEKSREYLDMLLNTVYEMEDSYLFFDLICQLIVAIKGQMNDEEFALLLELTLKNLKNHISNVFDFYFQLKEKGGSLSPQQWKKIFERLTNEPTFSLNGPGIDLLIFIFKRTNADYYSYDHFYKKTDLDIKNFNGLEQLWNILFQTGNHEISEELSQLYTSINKKESIEEFVNYCVNNFNYPIAQQTLWRGIELYEGNFDKYSLGISVNKFINEDKLISITVECSNQLDLDLKILPTISYKAFLQRISTIISLPTESFSLYEGLNLIQSKNFEPYDGMILTLREWQSYFKHEKSNETLNFPTKILKKTKYSKKLLQALSSNNYPTSSPSENTMNPSGDFDPRPFTLQILNEMETIKSEKVLISEINENTDWVSIFSPSQPYLLLYRLNIVGTMSQSKKWLRMFYQLGGAKVLLETIFLQCKNIFTDVKDIEDTLSICKFVISNLNNGKTKKSLFQSIQPSAVIEIIHLITSFLKISISSTTSLLYILVCFIKNVPTLLSDNTILEEVIALFKNTIFYKSSLIRSLSSEMANEISNESVEKEVISLLPEAVNSSPNEYFKVLLPISSKTNNQSFLYKQIYNIIFDHYNIKDLSQTEQFSFPYPSNSFTNGLFSILSSILSRFAEKKNEISDNELQQHRALFLFVLDNIVFNPIHYFSPGSELFKCLIYFIRIDNSLTKEILPRLLTLPEHYDENNISIKPSINIRKRRHERRGINNLGAICYMNASIQQLFNIPEFVQIILHNVMNEDWSKAFQLLIAKLKFYPIDYIDPTFFISKWKWTDNQPVNPRMQEDAVEFIQLLIDRLSEILPDISSLFKGTIRHEIIGTNVEYQSESNEDFITFPLEVRDHSCMKESFETFLEPDIFGPETDCYNAEGIGKISAKRFHHILVAPPILIAQLKRFTYSLSTGEREKVNDKYIFPHVLDITPYMQDTSIPVIYDLIGVEIHVGDALGGHYYSYAGEPGGRWYKLDDTFVSKFDSKKLPDIAMGGRSPYSYLKQYERSDNAYLCFYRKRPNPSDDTLSSSKEYPQISEEQNDDSLSSELTMELFNELHGIALEAIAKNSHYEKFLFQLAENSNDKEFVYEFLVKMLKMSSDLHMMKKLLNQCEQFFNNTDDPIFAAKFLEEEEVFSMYFFSRNYVSIREQLANIVNKCIDIVKPEQIIPYLHICSNLFPAMDSRWKFLDEFFIPLQHLEEKILQDEQSYAILQGEKPNYIEVIINLFQSLNKERENYTNSTYVFEHVQLSHAIQLLTQCLSSQEIRKSFEQRIFDENLIINLSINSINSKAFSNILLLYLKDSPSNLEKILSILKNKNVQPFSTASLFLVILQTDVIYDKNSIELIFNLINERDSQFISKFLSELTVRINISNLSAFIVQYADIIIKNWLCSLYLNIRNNSISLVQAFFPHFKVSSDSNDSDSDSDSSFELIYDYSPKKPAQKEEEQNHAEEQNHVEEQNQRDINAEKENLSKLSVALLKNINYLTSECLLRKEKKTIYYADGISYFDVFPHKEFFQLLSWAIISSDNKEIIYNYSNDIIQTIKKVGSFIEVAKAAPISFIEQVFSKDTIYLFFKTTKSFQNFLKALSNNKEGFITKSYSKTVLEPLIQILPNDTNYAQIFLKSSLCQESLIFCLQDSSKVASLFRTYVFENLKALDNQRLTSSVISFLWKDKTIQVQTQNSEEFINLSIDLMQYSPKSKIDFINLQHPFRLLFSVKKKITVNKEVLPASASQVLNLVCFSITDVPKKIQNKLALGITNSQNDLKVIFKQIYVENAFPVVVESVFRLMKHLLSLEYIPKIIKQIVQSTIELKSNFLAHIGRQNRIIALDFLSFYSMFCDKQKMIIRYAKDIEELCVDPSQHLDILNLISQQILSLINDPSKVNEIPNEIPNEVTIAYHKYLMGSSIEPFLGWTSVMLTKICQDPKQADIKVGTLLSCDDQNQTIKQAWVNIAKDRINEAMQSMTNSKENENLLKEIKGGLEFLLVVSGKEIIASMNLQNHITEICQSNSSEASDVQLNDQNNPILTDIINIINQASVKESEEMKEKLN